MATLLFASTEIASSSDVPTWLYCVCETGDSEEQGPCKLGVTANIYKRLSNLQAGNWRPLTIIWAARFPSQAVALAYEERCLGYLRPDIYGPDDRTRLASEWVEATSFKSFECLRKQVEATGEKLTELLGGG